ncbi:MAG: LamG-like jellyroll fold domain-containing protein [Candidatus Micrarchaeota archaeon]
MLSSKGNKFPAILLAPFFLMLTMTAGGAFEDGHHSDEASACAGFKGKCFESVEEALNSSSANLSRGDSVFVEVDDYPRAQYEYVEGVPADDIDDFVDIDSYMNQTGFQEPDVGQEGLFQPEGLQSYGELFEAGKGQGSWNEFPGAISFVQKRQARLNAIDIYPGDRGFSVALTFSTSRASADSPLVSSGECCGLEEYWAIELSTDGESAVLSIKLNDGSGEISGQGSRNLADGQKHRVVFVRDRASRTIRGYVDGRPELEFEDATNSISDSSEALCLGNGNQYEDGWFYGDMSDLVIFPHALGEVEAAGLSVG